MQLGLENLEIDTFTLTSSSQVADVVEELQTHNKHRLLIHIVSYIHNTVLVQTLKKELVKALPDARIVLLKHEDKTKTEVVVFNVNTQSDEEHISDEVLKEIYHDNLNKNFTMQEYRMQLFQRYFTDNLTNLPNLYQLRMDLQNDEEAGLILVKISNFQTINNFYGFVVGDFVLEQVGLYLKKILKQHIVYRLSGAEYAIVLEKSLGFYELKKYLQNFYEELQHIDVSYQDTKIFVDFTLGSTAKKDNENIFSKVSMALIYAKKKNVPFWIYEDRMNFENEYARNLKLSAIVRDAVEEGRIVPYFQAIVDNKTKKITKYECLARLVDERGKIISPNIFIPVAKDIKVYNKVTKQVINKSFETFKSLPYDFNINLSIEDIMNGDIFEFIIDKLQDSDIAPRVTFELLESEAIQDFKKVDRFISEVIRCGSKVAIDDFGSGYSNFSYLTKIQVDYIKIDGSLIENIDVDDASLIVVETIVKFAQKLGIKTIAEYVHSSVVMDKVRELNIDYSQGFYIDEPSVNI